MKILLFGEYSGLHTNLKPALETLGCAVDLVTSGDGSKGFRGSYPLIQRGNSRFGKLYADSVNYIILENNLRNQKYDVCQFISPRPGVITPHLGIEMRLIRRAISNSKKSLYLVAGCDSNTPRLSPSPSHFWGNLCVGCMKTNQVAECPQLPQSFQKIDNEFISAISGIISATSGGYAEIYKTSPKYLGSINFPMPIPKDFTGFLKCGERSFLHGINRYYYKGSDKIIPALERMQKKMGVDYEIVNGLEFGKYINTMRSNRFLIDQIYGDRLGMNALHGLANGRIVLTKYSYPKSPDNPAIPLSEDPQKIENAIEIAWNKSEREITELVDKSYWFLKEHHDPVEQAEKLLSLWSKATSKNISHNN